MTVLESIRLRLAVLKEITRVIKGHQIDRKQTLTVGDILNFIDIAIQNVKTAAKLEKARTSTVNESQNNVEQ